MCGTFSRKVAGEEIGSIDDTLFAGSRNSRRFFICRLDVLEISSNIFDSIFFSKYLYVEKGRFNEEKICISRVSFHLFALCARS